MSDNKDHVQNAVWGYLREKGVPCGGWRDTPDGFALDMDTAPLTGDARPDWWGEVLRLCNRLGWGRCTMGHEVLFRRRVTK